MEEALGKTATRELLPLQAGDIPSTFADVSRLQYATGYKPNTTVRDVFMHLSNGIGIITAQINY